mmetsp:Transcript_27448/g.79133  ORF Transcript_27448/g.79133 Transcript_27448/m.79133 type:complete len:256 (-) Transcript_27448:228-995(-)
MHFVGVESSARQVLYLEELDSKVYRGQPVPIGIQRHEGWHLRHGTEMRSDVQGTGSWLPRGVHQLNWYLVTQDLCEVLELHGGTGSNEVTGRKVGVVDVEPDLLGGAVHGEVHGHTGPVGAPHGIQGLGDDGRGPVGGPQAHDHVRVRAPGPHEAHVGGNQILPSQDRQPQDRNGVAVLEVCPVHVIIWIEVYGNLVGKHQELAKGLRCCPAKGAVQAAGDDVAAELDVQIGGIHKVDLKAAKVGRKRHQGPEHQ